MRAGPTKTRPIKTKSCRHWAGFRRPSPHGNSAGRYPEQAWAGDKISLLFLHVARGEEVILHFLVYLEVAVLDDGAMPGLDVVGLQSHGLPLVVLGIDLPDIGKGAGFEQLPGFIPEFGLGGHKVVLAYPALAPGIAAAGLDFIGLRQRL